MIDPSTKEGQAALRAICEAATEGPWAADFGEAYVVRDPNGGKLAGISFLGNGGKSGGRRPDPQPEMNTRVMAAARTALPACLDRIEALETEIERLRIAHKAIKALQPSGPHTSAKEGMSAYLTLFAKAKGLAMAALSETEGAE